MNAMLAVQLAAIRSLLAQRHPPTSEQHAFSLDANLVDVGAFRASSISCRRARRRLAAGALVPSKKAAN